MLGVHFGTYWWTGVECGLLVVVVRFVVFVCLVLGIVVLRGF